MLLIFPLGACANILLSCTFLLSFSSVLHHTGCLEPIFLHFSFLKIAQSLPKALVCQNSRIEGQEAERGKSMSLAQRGQENEHLLRWVNRV